MASCNQVLSGLVNDCASSKGGIVEALIANHEDVASVTVTEGQITAITMAESAKFKKYYFKRNTGQFTSTLNISEENGTKYVSTDIVLLFSRMETVKRIEMEALAMNDLAVIVKDANGKYWYFGYDEPVSASAGDGQTGTARGDSNRYSITLQDNSDTWPYEILVGEEGVDISSIAE